MDEVRVYNPPPLEQVTLTSDNLTCILTSKMSNSQNKSFYNLVTFQNICIVTPNKLTARQTVNVTIPIRNVLAVETANFTTLKLSNLKVKFGSCQKNYNSLLVVNL